MSGLKKQTGQTQNVRLMAVRSLMSFLKTQKIEFIARNSIQQGFDYTLYKHLVSSVIRHKRRYEFLIEVLSGKQVQKLDLEVVACLMVGLTQLEADSKIEAYAAIHETVELMVPLKKPYLKGFINANLRRFSRERKQLENDLQNQSLGIRSSHDLSFIERWENQFGADKTTEICFSNNVIPEVQLVVNPQVDSQTLQQEMTEDGYELSDLHEKGFTVLNPAGLFSSRWMEKGAFLVQDRAFQRLNKFLFDLPKTNVLDMCSAPGGKLIQLDWFFGSEITTLIGCELNGRRMAGLRRNIENVGSKPWLVQADALSPPFKSRFDLVLLDVPCSGTGTVRKHPEIKWSRSPQDFQRNHEAQLNMLNGCCQLLKQGGFLMYVTCSLEYEENQCVIEQFLKFHGRRFMNVPIKAADEDKEFITPEGYYQALPSAKQMGCFSALLKNCG